MNNSQLAIKNEFKKKGYVVLKDYLDNKQLSKISSQFKNI